MTVTGFKAAALDESAVKANIVAGSVTVTSRIPGDVNDDGEVDIFDCVRLKKYLAGFNVTINASNADVNGDGEINIQVVNCSFNGKSGDTQYRYTMMTKLQAMIAGDQNAMLFITDEDSYKYLADLSDGDGLFDGEPFMLGEEFYKATETDSYGKLPEGLRIVCRRVSDTVLESKKGSVDAHTNAEKTLEAIKSGKKN